MITTTELTQPRHRRRRFTTDDYHRMGEAGLFAESSRVELIEGDVIEMSPVGSDHVGTVADLTMAIAPKVAGRAVLSVQSPIRLDPYSEPQPDLVVLRPRADRYRGGLPTPADVLLLVEVADSSVAYDRGTKLPLYARHGLREVWIVNIRSNRVEIYRRPGPEGYAEKLEVGPGDTLSPEALPELRLAAGDLLV